MPSRHLGLDLGGTNIKTAVLEPGPPPGWRVVMQASTPTGALDGPDAVLGRLVAAGEAAVRAAGPLDGVGLAVPGLFDAGTGEIVLFPNLPGPWPGRAVAAELEAALNLPVALVNDARAGTLAEARIGAAAGCATVVCVVLGTGVGGGVVVDGRLRTGPHGRAGEVGHQVLVVDGEPCGCGNRGCLEAYAGAAALSRLGGRGTPEEVVIAARAGDEVARAALGSVAARLAHGLGNVLTVLLPERIVVGGGVAAAGELLLGPLRRELVRRAPMVPADWYDVVPAAVGPLAGAVGAALFSAESGGVAPGQPVPDRPPLATSAASRTAPASVEPAPRAAGTTVIRRRT
jgi:glucokinase